MKFCLMRWSHLGLRQMTRDQRYLKKAILNRKSRSRIARSCEKLFRMQVHPCKRLQSLEMLTPSPQRKIRLRLHGTRLPKDYTVVMRMDKTTNFVRPIREGPKRRRRHPSRRTMPQAPSTSDSESPPPSPNEQEPTPRSPSKSQFEAQRADNAYTADLEIQRNNAYPGSTNTIGSIHQRRWYLSLDRESSGFERTVAVSHDKGLKERKRWTRKPDGQGFEPFYVHGPEAERSVVTMRLGRDVLDDEGEEFVPRRGWRPVLH